MGVSLFSLCLPFSILVVKQKKNPSTRESWEYNSTLQASALGHSLGAKPAGGAEPRGPAGPDFAGRDRAARATCPQHLPPPPGTAPRAR